MINGYYSIGETAHLTGLSIKAIRHYANENLVPPSALSESGYRLYAESDIWRLVLVRMLREMEFGLPQIRKILNRSLDIPSVIRWQKEVLDLQIAHLTNARSRLEQIPCEIFGNASLAYLHTILEAMSMSKEDKQAWLTERWSETMIPEGVSEDWKIAFLQQLKDSLPSEWNAEQTKAWTELQEFLNDPVHRNQLQETVRPFLQMLEKQNVEPDEWSKSMGKLIDRAMAANQASLSADDTEVQSIVDEWIKVFSTALKLPVDETFAERFSYYAEVRDPNRRLWDIMVRLNPEKMEARFRAQELMLAGLRWRLKQSK